MPIPAYDRMFNPVLASLRLLGGSATIEELAASVANAMGLSDADLAETSSDGNRSRFEYRLAWARSYLKSFGLLANSVRGVWSLTERGRSTETVDPREVKRVVKGRLPIEPTEPITDRSQDASTVGLRGEPEPEADRWEAQLGNVLSRITPDQFERLCQRLLRESGFTQVVVTGRAGDGGIDGVGVVRLGGLLSFPVLFQCKRYRGTIGPSIVRDFRGAMVGRADRGLILSTGAFTRDAKAEATRDGAPPIDLVDGEALAVKLRELKLGIGVEQVEHVSVDEDWFFKL